MITLQIIFMSMTCLAILLILIFLVLLFLFLQTGKKIKRLQRKRVKNPKKRKRLAIVKKKLKKNKKSFRNKLIVTLICAVLTAGGAFWISYYQSMSLTEEDSKSIVKSYYLLNDFEAQLEEAGVGVEAKEKLDANIRYLTSMISSYGTKKASIVNSIEGQLVINQYYNMMQELGANAIRVVGSFYENPELVEEYKQDIEKVKRYQKKVMTFYKIDEEALRKQALD
ncbi:hypothetical protein ACYSNR_11360 [Enterococcus sp. LJL128]|uniref:hypothetical protein n=1 Tax=Enterococcus sp. LJL51 TaxID=3416656 RepID=UPI003CF8418A